jgi:signal transduction histidine kinase
MRNRLLLVMVGLVALLLAVHDIPLAPYLERVERDRLVTSLERDAFIIAGQSEEALEDGTAADDPSVSSLIARYSEEEGVRVVIVDAEATGVVGSDDRALAEDFSNRPEIVDALELGEPQTGERYSETLGADLFYVAVPVLSGVERVGAVRISAPEGTVSDRVDDRVRGLLFVALISLLMAVFVAWIFARSITRPLSRLRATTDQLAGGDLGARADEDAGPPEIRALAGSFNSMSGRLEQLVERQRAFAGTASHQLRTPLTALRLRLEQLAGEVDDGAAGTVDAALVETDRLHRMIEGLLALSRTEDAAAGPVAIDLSEVVRDRVVYWEPLADEQGVTVTAVIPDGTSVLAVAGAAEQIVDNLVDNALEVSPAGAELVVSLVPGERSVELHVIDEGPGLSEDERAHAFERFWRGADAPPGGSGLGLAIVHQLVAASGGTAELRAAPSGGIDAVISFRAPAGP